MNCEETVKAERLLWKPCENRPVISLRVGGSF
jgi:hypothetical protein